MHRFLFWLLLWPLLIFGAVEFDCIFIGTSPICVLEAVAQHYAGKRVLLLDEADDLGGAWRTVDICGVMHADVGCHQIGSDLNIRDFLEQYVGCPMVHMDHPLERYDPAKQSPNGLYFAEGCHGLIEGLKQMLEKTSIEVLLEHRVDSATVNVQEKCVLIRSGNEEFTATKVFVPTYSSFACQQMAKTKGKTNFYHLYMLIQDASPFRFTYQGTGGPKVSRVMNLTPFVGLSGSGRQLLIFQTHGEQTLQEGQALLDDLKKKQLVAPEAYILRQEPYIYEQKPHHSVNQLTVEQRSFFEQIDTSHFMSMSSRIGRWKMVIPKIN